MKKAVEGGRVTLQENIPLFSLDPKDLEELESLLAKWGFTGAELKEAGAENESITGNFAEVSLKLSSRMNSIRIPTLFFARRTGELFGDQVWIHDPWFEDMLVREPTIIVRLRVDKEKEGQDIINAVHGFIVSKSKDLKSDEEPGILYFRPKESTDYRKLVPKPSPDRAKILRNTFESKLRKMIRNQPQQEKEIQDAVENILAVKDYEYHREIEHVPSGSRATIADFTIDNIGVAVEVKLCKAAADERRILEEINADISTYKSRYPKVVFVVYDLGIIRDIDMFGRDILSHDGIYLTVIKH